MSESPVETLQKALGLHFISKRCLTCLWQFKSHVEFTASNFDDARQFFNVVRNPNITVSNRKKRPELPLNFQKRPYYPAMPRLHSWVLPHTYTGVLTSMNRLEFRMDIPAVTREYTPGSCRNSTKPRRLSSLRKMRPDSPSLCPEHLRFPNQTRMEPRFAWLNSREYPTTLSQDEKNTDVTPGMQNSSVYPKSNWDEANFPCIGPITTPRSTSYRTSGLTPFRNLERLPETTVSSIEDHQFQ